MPIVKTSSGHEKVHVSNLSDISVTTDGLEGLQTAGNASLSSIDTKVGIAIKANDGNDGSGTERTVKCDGNGILQVKEIGTVNIAPANTVNGELTPTQSFAVGLRGRTDITNSATGKFLLCDIEGKLVTSNTSNRSAEVSIVSATAVLASAQIGSDINIGDSKTIVIYGSATGNHNFILEHSSDGSNWYLNSVVSPVAHGGIYHYNVKAENGLQFYRLINNNTGNTFTLNYITL